MIQPFQPLGPRQPGWVDSAGLLKRNQLGVTPEGEAPPAASHDSVSLSKKDKEREERERNQKTYRRPTFPMPPVPAPRQAAGGFILKNAPQPKAEKPMKEEDLPSYGRWSGAPLEPEPWPDLEFEPDWSCPDWVEPLLADPPEKAGRTRLAWLLCRFGPGIVRRCIDFGLTVHLGAEFARQDLQVTVLAGAAPAHIYEAFARAYDLALGDGSCASLSSLAVLSNYHQCRAQDPRWSGPDHFFAEQLAVFLSGGVPASVAMGGYVDYLLKQSGGFKGEER